VFTSIRFGWSVTSIVPFGKWRVQLSRLLAEARNLAGDQVVFRGRLVVSRNRAIPLNMLDGEKRGLAR
jgi:hypothetical protein